MPGAAHFQQPFADPYTHADTQHVVPHSHADGQDVSIPHAHADAQAIEVIDAQALVLL